MSRNGRCEHGRMLRHAPEPTTSTAVTSGRPSGLHPTASHTATMVAPFDPRARAAQIRDFIFGRTDPSQNVIQVQAVKAGITTITGVLMGRSDGFLHFPPARRNPPPYSGIFSTGDLLSGTITVLMLRKKLCAPVEQNSIYLASLVHIYTRPSIYMLSAPPIPFTG